MKYKFKSNATIFKYIKAVSCIKSPVGVNVGTTLETALGM
jgi:hypothetical protein